jgi:serine protease Do
MPVENGNLNPPHDPNGNIVRRPNPLRKLRAALVATALFVAVSGVALNYHMGSQSVAAEVAPRAAINPPVQISPSPFSFADLVQRVSPAVVTVAVEHTGPAQVADMPDMPSPFGDFFRQFGDGQMFGQNPGSSGQRRFGQRQERPNERRAPRSEARGAGFIIASDGYIVTNNHVVDGGSKITVKLPDGREFQARLIGTDKDTDVAVLKIDGERNLPTVAFGDDRRLRVGDWVVAVGNPFGLGGTVTAGIVSSIGRDIGNGPYTDYLQIDAPINQGNSGGPTFDLTGRVVGMNTAIYSPSGGSVGIGFAIPASTIQSVVSQLKDHGSVTRGWLGVQIQSLTPEMASSLGVSNAKGAIVAGVVPDSPAAKAGMKQGDVVLSLNGTNVDDSRDLTRRVSLLHAGDKAEFTVFRDGRKQEITALIGKRDREQQASADPRPRSQASPSAETALGLELSQATPEMRQQYGLKNGAGVVVTDVDPESDAAYKGLQAGDVIVKVGNQDVHAPSDVSRYVAEAKRAGRGSVLMLVAGVQGDHFVTVKIA